MIARTIAPAVLREFLEPAVFETIEESHERIGRFIDYYNFQRTITAHGPLSNG